MARLCTVLCPTLMVALAAGGCSEAPRTFKRPAALALAAGGGLYVSDFHHSRVVHLDADGALLGTLGERGLGEGHLWHPWDVVPDGPERVLVLNQRITDADDETDVWEVKAFEGGREVGAWVLPDKLPDGTPGAGWPDALARASDGTWLVPDTATDALLRFDASWQLLGRVTAPQGGPPFEAPSYITRVGDELWTVEQYAHRVRRLTGELRELTRFGEHGRGPGQLSFPSALAVCPRRWVAVADFGNFRVQRFDLAGRPLDGFSPDGVSKHAPPQLMAIAVTPDCQRLVLVDSKGHRVLITTPQGRVVQDIRSW